MEKAMEILSEVYEKSHQKQRMCYQGKLLPSNWSYYLPSGFKVLKKPAHMKEMKTMKTTKATKATASTKKMKAMKATKAVRARTQTLQVPEVGRAVVAEEVRQQPSEEVERPILYRCPPYSFWTKQSQSQSK